MYDLLHALAKWLEATGWATVIRTTRIYPYIQLIHFSGLTVWLGSNTIVDLRILGLGQKRQTAAQLAEALLPWNWIGFSIVVLGGFLLFSGIGTTYLVNSAFRVKLGIFVPLALIWHIVVQRKVRIWGREPETPPIAKLSALIEILLWLCVVTAAVEIPNY
jgi:uncharacterized protein DUF6644